VHYLRKLEQEIIVSLVYCSTYDYIVDIFTKTLTKDNYVKHRGMLGLLDTTITNEHVKIFSPFEFPYNCVEERVLEQKNLLNSEFFGGQWVPF